MHTATFTKVPCPAVAQTPAEKPEEASYVPQLVMISSDSDPGGLAMSGWEIAALR